MFKRKVLLRSIAVLCAALLTGYLGFSYYNSHLYTGPVSRDGASFQFVDLLVIILLLVVLKFILFDLLASFIIKKC